MKILFTLLIVLLLVLAFVGIAKGVKQNNSGYILGALSVQFLGTIAIIIATSLL